jgi:hypothetical protein
VPPPGHVTSSKLHDLEPQLTPLQNGAGGEECWAEDVNGARSQLPSPSHLENRLLPMEVDADPQP